MKFMWSLTCDKRTYSLKNIGQRKYKNGEMRMEQENYKVRAEELRKQIEYHSNRYYNMDDPRLRIMSTI